MTSEKLEQMEVVPGEQLEPDEEDMQVSHILDRIVSVLFHPISDMDILKQEEGGDDEDDEMLAPSLRTSAQAKSVRCLSSYMR